jgi:spore coat polysaccharide biosynthesis predicted glycosyltransferase SpsG
MYEIAFRCDASKYPKIGTGHLHRSLAIAEALSEKYNLKKNKIVFVCKKNSLFNKVKKIILSKNFKVLHFVKKNEISFLKRLNSKNIIFDRIEYEKKELIKMVKKKFKKVIFFESTNNEINGCMRINSLIHRKNIKYSGYNYLISPLINEKKNKINANRRKVFINLGGINKKLSYKIYESLKNIKELKFCLPTGTKINQKNVDFYDAKNFYKKLKESKIVICSGGLIFFDAIFLNKSILVFAKDKHQKTNLYNINRLYKTKIPLIRNIKHLKSCFVEIFKKRNNPNILNLKNMDHTLKLIYNYLYA